jgi:hypothetical protein
MEPVSTSTIGGFTVEIYVDEDCASPREHDTLGTIVAWHRRYNLSDNPKQFTTPGDFHAFLAREKPSLVLPVYMFDHSGIALATTDFGDPWDSVRWGTSTPPRTQSIARTASDVSLRRRSNAHGVYSSPRSTSTACT